MDVRIQGTNLELTDELRAFVDKKMQTAYRALGALDRDPVQVDIELEKTTRRHPQEREDQRRYRAEANITVPGRLIRAEGSADDIHQSVVEMKHRLAREIRDWRERLIDERREGGRRIKHELGEEIEEEYDQDISDEAETKFADEIETFESEVEKESD